MSRIVPAGTIADRSINCPGVFVAPASDWIDTTTPITTGAGRTSCPPGQGVTRQVPFPVRP